MALCLTQGVGAIWLAWRHRIPVTLAWSTPGAALLVSTGVLAGGFSSAVGAFVFAGLLIVATALLPGLGRLVQTIPTPISQAMLAGVVLPLCLAPVMAMADSPVATAPVIAVWLVLLWRAPRWASPAALVAALGIAIAIGGDDIGTVVYPTIELVGPTWSWQAVVSLGLPLYLVTMAAQNVPGAAVLASFGYQPPWRSAMLTTGIGTVVGAPAGGHTINLAAISAALSASPEAGRDPKVRWVAALTAGVCYLVIGFSAALLTALVFAAPAGLIEAAAGLALMTTLASALRSSMSHETGQEAAIVTFVVAASGVAFAGIGAAFWALIIGLVLYWVIGLRRA